VAIATQKPPSGGFLAAPLPASSSGIKFKWVSKARPAGRAHFGFPKKAFVPEFD